MKQRNVLKHFLPEIKKHKGWLALMVFSMFFSFLPNVIIPMKIGDIIDFMSKNQTDAYGGIMEIFTFLVVVYVFMVLAWRVNEIAITYFETKGMKDISLRCFYVIQGHSVQFFEEQFTGALVKKTDKMVRAFERIFDIAYFNFLQDILYIVFGLIIFSIKIPIMGFLFFLWSFVFFVANYVFSNWKLKHDIELSRLDSSIGAMQADSFGNYASVKIFGQEEYENIRYKKLIDIWSKKNFYVWNLHNYANFFQASFMITFELFLLYFAIQKWKEGALSAGEIIFMQSYLLLVFNHLWELGRQIRDFYKEIGNAYEMVEILEESIEVQDQKDAQNLIVKDADISFQNVDFAYSKSHRVFSDFSLNMRSGEKLAIVGQSGSGKSTLTKILLRFYNIQSGSIKIDGQNIAHVKQESLRKNISFVPQNVDLFHRTIAENIAYGNTDASMEEIIDAAKKAHAHEFITGFSDGYETFVGERGVKLSGGEKQRIGIARAILENKKILVLDEATSALDSVTEKKIQSAMENAMNGKTVIVIAHRLSTIKKSDRLIVLDDGKIVEEGSHESLLEKQGKYSELWSHQVGGFLID